MKEIIECASELQAMLLSEIIDIFWDISHNMTLLLLCHTFHLRSFVLLLYVIAINVVEKK